MEGNSDSTLTYMLFVVLLKLVVERPNDLRQDGKVCLSLLGTWQGPGWIAGKSTLLQVRRRSLPEKH